MSKYNYSNHAVAKKFFATIFYLLEYVIVTPIIIVLWFAALAIVLMLIAESYSIDQVLLVSAAIIGAIRILAYYKGEISKDLA